MPVSVAEMCLERPSKVYYAGEAVTGQVKLKLPSERRIFGIVLAFEGKGETSFFRWFLSTTTYQTNIKCFKQEIEIPLDSNLPAGEYSFPFVFTLPSGIPSTFRGKHGHIEYTILASFKRSTGHKRDIIAYLLFSVISPLDLNEFDALKEPAILHLNKKFFSIGESGTLRAEISFPASGYISGQSIPITIDVANDSNVRVNQIQIILKRKEKYIFHEGGHYLVEKSSKNIAEAVVDGVEAKSSSKQK